MLMWTLERNLVRVFRAGTQAIYLWTEIQTLQLYVGLEGINGRSKPFSHEVVSCLTPLLKRNTPQQCAQFPLQSLPLNSLRVKALEVRLPTRTSLLSPLPTVWPSVNSLLTSLTLFSYLCHGKNNNTFVMGFSGRHGFIIDGKTLA